MRIKTFARVSVLMLIVFLFMVPLPALSQNYQSCGMLGGAVCNGPNIAAPNITFMNGLDCGGGCVVSMNNGAGFCGAAADVLIANFFTNTTMFGCDFDCGARGKCSIRGSDGLPVELMEFSVDE